LLAVWGAGFWALLRDAKIDRAVRWVISIWALVTVGGVLLLTPLEWQRYYVPVYPVVGLLAATGLVWLARVGRQITGKPGQMEGDAF
jgi:hypothetical protein